MRCLLLAVLLVRFVPLFADVTPIREALQRGRYQEALDACDRQLRMQPKNYQVWTLKGISLQMLGRHQDSLAAFRKALALQPKYVPALQASAQLEYSTGDPHCRKSLERLLELEPDNSMARAMLGVLAYESQDCEAAVRSFDSAGPGLAANPVVRWQYGICLYELRRPDAAAAQFRELLMRKEDAEVRYNLALSLHQANRPAEVVSVLEPLADRTVPESDVLGLLALAYEANRRTPEAIRTLRRALDLYPREERHYVDLASICMEHSAVELGIEILEIGTKNIPSSAKLHAILGMFYVKVSRMAQAEAEFLRSEELAPDRSYGSVGLGLALLQANEVEESIRLLRSQLERDPKNPRIMFTLAQALLQASRKPEAPEFQEAYRLLQCAVALNPGDARALGLLGKGYLVLDDLSNAIRALEKAVRIDPNDRSLVYQLMIAYASAGEKNKADQLQARVRELLATEKTTEKQIGQFLLMKEAPSRHGPP